MSPTSTYAKRREWTEPRDESPNSLTREGREERGEGGGAKGEEGREVRSMTSRGFVHSSLGMTDTLVHVHVGFGLGSTGTQGAPSRFPQSLFLSRNSFHSFCSAALAAFVVGQLG